MGFGITETQVLSPDWLDQVTCPSPNFLRSNSSNNCYYDYEDNSRICQHFYPPRLSRRQGRSSPTWRLIIITSGDFYIQIPRPQQDLENPGWQCHLPCSNSPMIPKCRQVGEPRGLGIWM